MKNLEYQTQKLPELGKNCVLLFDEMALDTGLTHDTKNDMIFGFDSFGKQLLLKIADHVLVFMLRGIRRKYKQPIAYYFFQGTTKTPNVAVCIKEVIQAVQTTGLKVRAVICDQGSTNQAAVNCLKEETKRHCLMNNIENKYIGFLVGGEEIVCLFDPPHLLKCVRNNLLTKNLMFMWKGESLIANWDDIQTLYSFDKEN